MEVVETDQQVVSMSFDERYRYAVIYESLLVDLEGFAKRNVNGAKMRTPV
jgi:hypothetical protein